MIYNLEKKKSKTSLLWRSSLCYSPLPFVYLGIVSIEKCSNGRDDIEASELLEIGLNLHCDK